jgi:hypothetical protein
MTGKTLILRAVSRVDTREILARALPYNASVEREAWREEGVDGIGVIRPARAPRDAVVAFSGRGSVPEGERSPTAYLARRFSAALGLDGLPIHWARQMHGVKTATIRDVPAAGVVSNAGECDALVADKPGVALVVQTADCVPILLWAPTGVGAAHAGWRGSAKNVAGSAVAALHKLGIDSAALRAWLGPSIGPCCYEVGGEVAAQFAGDFVRASCGGRFRLDLRATNIAQLAAAGVPRGNILTHPACTKCGGEKYASWRRDGANAGRMIALIARR